MGPVGTSQAPARHPRTWPPHGEGGHARRGFLYQAKAAVSAPDHCSRRPVARSAAQASRRKAADFRFRPPVACSAVVNQLAPRPWQGASRAHAPEIRARQVCDHGHRDACRDMKAAPAPCQERPRGSPGYCLHREGQRRRRSLSEGTLSSSGDGPIHGDKHTDPAGPRRPGERAGGRTSS
jgi:hypothetical protein